MTTPQVLNSHSFLKLNDQLLYIPSNDAPRYIFKQVFVRKKAAFVPLNLSCNTSKRSVFYKSSLKYNGHVVDFSFVSEAIKDYVNDGLFEDAVRLYIEMLHYGSPPDNYWLLSWLIKAVGELSGELGKGIHGHVLKLGVLDGDDDDVSVVNSILCMYWKYWMIDDAVRMFEGMPKRDVVSWNIMISGACRCGYFESSLETFSAMVREFGVSPNRVSCVSALSSCGSLGRSMQGREIHGFVVKNGLACDPHMVSVLIDMYVNCGNVGTTERIFRKALDIDAVKESPVTWNTMIFGYVSCGYFGEALMMFIEMLESGIKTDPSTIMAALVLCSKYLKANIVQQIHGLICRRGVDTDPRIAAALIDAYFKCGDAETARKIFTLWQSPSVNMYCIIITNHGQGGFADESLELCHEVVHKHGYVDPVIILAALRACSLLSLKKKGMEFHALAVKMELTSDLFIGGALVDFYAKCKDTISSQDIFNRLAERDLVAWNALIAAYAQNDFADDALRAFCDMQLENIKPNSVTTASILSACAQLSAMILCKEVHCYILRQGLESNLLVSNSLIAAYAKCGDIGTSRNLFDNLDERNLITWNSIIAGLGTHGYTEEMFALFKDMKSSDVMPDHATFTSLLSACSHSGCVNEGWEYFRSMAKDYELEPRLEHYTCIVDLLGRAGHLKEAYDFIMAMPCTPDDRIWGSLLGACKSHDDEQLAEIIANHILELDEDTIGYHILLANLYEASGKLIQGSRLRSAIKEKGLKKTPGCSWIEINNNMHCFTASDTSHFKSSEIYTALGSLTIELIREGYVPQSSRLLNGIEAYHENLFSSDAIVSPRISKTLAR